MEYKPRKEQALILDRSYELIQGVPYQVSARWLFYRLLTEGYFKGKDDYRGHFLPLLAKARKSFYKDWRPDTLADDTRVSVIRGTGHDNEKAFLEAVARAECRLDKWNSQAYYMECWFEAKAMRSQFEYCTKYMTLRPFGGDPSIPYKFQIAKELEQADRIYAKPIKIIYFGDLDPKGLMIPESAVKDIREWCSTPFEFIRAGLTLEQAQRHSIPEQPDKPGVYQWEALDDQAAEEIIGNAMYAFVDMDLFTREEEKEKEITERFQNNVKKYLVG